MRSFALTTQTTSLLHAAIDAVVAMRRHGLAQVRCHHALLRLQKLAHRLEIFEHHGRTRRRRPSIFVEHLRFLAPPTPVRRGRFSEPRARMRSAELCRRITDL